MPAETTHQFATGQEVRSLAEKLYMGEITIQESVRELKKQYILTVLEEHGGNICQSAIEMNMHRNTLYRIMDELKIDVRGIKELKKRPKSMRCHVLRTQAG
jgi:Fis family transcriptional regulator